MILDTVTSSILDHLFKNKKINYSQFSDVEKQKCLSILLPLDITIENFFQNSTFSDSDRGQILFNLMKQDVDILALGEHLDWKKFELFISTIFNQVNYTVLTNFRFKDELTKYEIDVIAFKLPYIFVIDCKFYRIMTSSLIKDAVEKQRERVEALVESFPILSDELTKKLLLPIKRKLFLFPILISWRDHNIQFYQNIPIVPYNQLSGFLQEIDENRENLFYLNIRLN